MVCFFLFIILNKKLIFFADGSKDPMIKYIMTASIGVFIFIERPVKVAFEEIERMTSDRIDESNI